MTLPPETVLALLGAVYKLLWITSISSHGVDQNDLVPVGSGNGGSKLPVRWANYSRPPSVLKVVGGASAGIGQFPYQVSLRNSAGHFCGGSIISNNWILTAAHCLENESPLNITVVVGSIYLNAGGTPYRVSRMFPHEKYDLLSPANDIAVLKLHGTILFTDTVKKISLATVPTLTQVNVALLGWGSTMYPTENQPNKLQYVLLRTMPIPECRKSMREEHPPIYESNVCAFRQFGQGACHGDSGGPLVDIATGLQIGITSWVIPCAQGSPDVFTSVPYFHPWILEKTGITL